MKYKVLKNFLSEPERKLLLEHTIIKHRLNLEDFDGRNNNLDTSYYGDSIMESLMLTKKEIIEKEWNKTLLPTYTFWRIYTNNSELFKHKDRPSCEFSSTIFLGSCGTEWPIFMEGESISLNAGDAVIYKGIELEHWREPYKGDWHSQVFIHYVDANGPHKDHKFDKRPRLGMKNLNGS